MLDLTKFPTSGVCGSLNPSFSGQVTKALLYPDHVKTPLSTLLMCMPAPAMSKEELYGWS
jgi:hypothetical protein